MRKQILYTSAGVVFALVIILGGWSFTGDLLQRREDFLLSSKGSIEAPVQADTPLKAEQEKSYPVMKEGEIYQVLNEWEYGGEEILHEPMEGQLTMWEAFNAGKEGLAYFREQGIFPENGLAEGKINAYLCRKQLPVSILPYHPVMQSEENRNEQELEPFYSYWTVTFSDGDDEAVLTINAATGKIWKVNAKLTSSDGNGKGEEEMADSFLQYLELENNSLFKANIQRTSTETGQDSSQILLKISLGAA